MMPSGVIPASHASIAPGWLMVPLGLVSMLWVPSIASLKVRMWPAGSVMEARRFPA